MYSRWADAMFHRECLPELSNSHLSVFFAKLLAVGVLQTFLHEITDTAGLFLSSSRPIFIVTKVALNLPTLSSRGRTK